MYGSHRLNHCGSGPVKENRLLCLLSRTDKSSPVLPPAEEPADGGDENAPAGEQELSLSYSVGEDNKPVLAYTVPSDVTEQIDLMTAHHTYAGNGSECARLTFSHALPLSP